MTEIIAFYLTQGVLGITVLVLFTAVVHLYRENRRLVEAMLSTLKSENDGNMKVIETTTTSRVELTQTMRSLVDAHDRLASLVKERLPYRGSQG